MDRVIGILSVIGYSVSLSLGMQYSELLREKSIRMNELSDIPVHSRDYIPNISDDDVGEYFKLLDKDRWLVYFSNGEDFGKPDTWGHYKELYATPENWKACFSRYKFPMAFKYNMALPNYSASVMDIDGIKFLAIEAPSSENKKAFLKIFQSYDVGCFVRLNVPDEYTNDNYYCYWDHKTQFMLTGRGQIPLVNLNWPHRRGVNIEQLGDSVRSVYSFMEANSSKFIAVSCRAGAGRTCTFISAYALFAKIHSQRNTNVKKVDINVNIDDVFWQVSIQRPFAVTHADQYLSLCRFVDKLVQDNHMDNRIDIRKTSTSPKIKAPILSRTLSSIPQKPKDSTEDDI